MNVFRVASTVALLAVMAWFAAGVAVADEPTAVPEATNSPWVRIISLIVVAGVIYFIVKVGRQYSAAAERDAAEAARSGREDA